ncbi:restriction endonuclease [Bacillus sp. XF8]|uniref:restriction endonuclease n=1 Tax=Bacillus sp. XF8 TaxID=2819289 RepID=UPI001FB84A8E|nr:restriction endonuclease [Bacillus sp. XF8]
MTEADIFWLLAFIIVLIIVVRDMYKKHKYKKKYNLLRQEEIARNIQREKLRIKREQEICQSNIDEIDCMEGKEFEQYLRVLFQSLDYHVEVTKESGDFGADLILTNNNNKIIVQAKRYKNNVGIQAVQEIVGAKGYYNADHAWVVTNSYFTAPARKLAAANEVLLIDRELLIKLSAQVNQEKLKETV